METISKKAEKISQSITLKAIVIGILSLLMLIPSAIIQDLIRERETRSDETILKINEKWSNSQMLMGPVLTIPYTYTYEDEKKVNVTENHTLNIFPETLKFNVKLFPEERHYGIYKSILYKSNISMTGKFPKIDFSKINFTTIKWDEATIRIGISDLRGITNNIDFELNNQHYTAEAGGNKQDVMGRGLIISPINMELFQSGKNLDFNCMLNLNGSSNMNFIPVGKTTQVDINGAWKSPGFIGSFSPEHRIDKNGFSAKWNILHFNRPIPETWLDENIDTLQDSSFGVSLVDTVDHYQQNMRSAKYALMFIVLTFVVFFFVEVITKKRIHPVQYLFVGIALILFYSLLLSISEQLNFAWAYLIASIATLSLISIYAHSIFKNKMQTAILSGFLTLLYTFLYVILQLEDIALLIGSIGLFVILAVIMFVSKKISWYKPEEEIKNE